MSAFTRRCLYSASCAFSVTALGYFLNRALDWDQIYAFPPTSLLTRVVGSDAFGRDTYPDWLQATLLTLHLAFLGALAYVLFALVARRSAQSAQPPRR